MRVRAAAPDDLPAVMNVLDAGLLDVDADAVRGRIEDGDVIVAVEGGHILGALVLDGARVDAVAVRPGRRGQGIGSALVGAASDRIDGALIADFDERVREFYEALGFAVDPADEPGRYRGVLDR